MFSAFIGGQKVGERRKCNMARRVKTVGNWITRRLRNFTTQATRKEIYETKIMLLEKDIAELKAEIAELKKTKKTLEEENADLEATVENLRREDRNAQVTIRLLKDQLQIRCKKQGAGGLARRRTQAGRKRTRNARLSDFI